MFIDSLREKYLPEIARLEQKSYPIEIAWGLKGLKHEINEHNAEYLSLCGFEKGELVCYIIAYKLKAPKIHNKEPIYISDINCPNPMYLQRLLLCFFRNCKGTKEGEIYYEAEFRENSYRLLCNQARRHGDRVKILAESCIPDYYGNGEKAYKITFCVDIDKYLEEDWRKEFRCRLDASGMNIYNSIMNKTFHILQKQIAMGIDLSTEQNRVFIIKSIKEWILGYYQMFGEKIPVFYQMKIYAGKGQKDGGISFQKTIETLKSKGYTVYETEERYSHMLPNVLTVRRNVEIYNTAYRDQLSGYRWLQKSQQSFWGEKKGDIEVYYLNRYGMEQYLLPVPYLTNGNYLYHLKKTTLYVLMMEKVLLQLPCEDHICFDEMFQGIFCLLSSKNAELCIKQIVTRCCASNNNYFHDWLLLVHILEKAKDILTEGAMKTLLMQPYQQAMGPGRKIKAITELILNKKTVRKKFDIKAMRKTLSSLIRNRKDLTGYITSLRDAVSVVYQKQKHIPKEKMRQLLAFMERMQRYCVSVNLESLFSNFGNECLFQFVEGTYPCVFEHQEFSMPVYPLTKFLLAFLENRTRKAKRVYHELKSKNLLIPGKNAEMTKEQYDEIIRILRRHNVELPDTVCKDPFAFLAVVEQKGSPEFLVAGDASVCCMGYGEHKAMIYAVEEGFGILNIYYKGRIVANSVIWINEPYQCLVLDNIEVHPNYVRFGKELKECFCHAAGQLQKKYQLKFVVQGLRYSDLDLYEDDSHKIDFARMEPLRVNTEYFYSDARQVRVVMQTIPDEEMERLICKVEQEEYKFSDEELPFSNEWDSAA